MASHAVTVYNLTDPGGWAPLPADPDDLPWRSGPLAPSHTPPQPGALPAGWAAPPLSFSIVLQHALAPEPAP